MLKKGSAIFYFFVLVAVAVFVVSAVVGILTLRETAVEETPSNLTQQVRNLSFDILTANNFPNRIEIEVINRGDVNIDGFLVYAISNNGTTTTETEFVLEVGQQTILTVSPLPSGILDRVQVVPRVFENGTYIYLYPSQREYLFNPQLYCGNNICELGENSASCAADCRLSTIISGGGGGDGGNGNGGSGPVCGNGQCEAGENSTSCAGDCINPITAVCGNFVCETTEDVNNCATDCFSITAWSWPTTGNRLDYLPQLDMPATVYEPYFYRSQGTTLIPALMVSVQRQNTQTPEFVLQFNPDYFTNYNPQQHYERFVSFYQGEFPNTVLGSYISGADCDFDATNYPIQEIDCDNFLSDELLYQTYPSSQPNRWRVNLTDQTTANKFINLTLREAFNRKRQFIYLDTILHPNSGGWSGTSMTWEMITSQLSTMKTSLNARGIKLATNFAGTIWTMKQNSFHDADLFMNSVDGMSFEGSIIFHPLNTREFPSRMQDNFEVYRIWLDADKVIMFIPTEGNVMANLYAALAMMIYEPGDSLFLSKNYFWEYNYTNYFWSDWSGRFGEPQEDRNFAVDGTRDWTVSRQFANGKIFVRHRVVLHDTSLTFDLPDSNINNIYSVVLSPTTGQLTPIDSDTFSYTPQASFSGSDAVVFASDYNANSQSYRNVIVVGINIANPVCGNYICELTETMANCPNDCQSSPN